MKEDEKVCEESSKYLIINKQAKYLDQPIFTDNEPCDITLDLSKPKTPETLKQIQNYSNILVNIDDESGISSEELASKRRLSQHSIMSIYEIIWFMTDLPKTNNPDASRETIVQIIEEKYPLQESDIPNSIGKLSIDSTD